MVKMLCPQFSAIQYVGLCRRLVVLFCLPFFHVVFPALIFLAASVGSFVYYVGYSAAIIWSRENWLDPWTQLGKNIKAYWHVHGGALHHVGSLNRGSFPTHKSNRIIAHQVLRRPHRHPAELERPPVRTPLRSRRVCRRHLLRLLRRHRRRNRQLCHHHPQAHSYGRLLLLQNIQVRRVFSSRDS